MASTSTAERSRSAPATPTDRARRQREDQRLMRLVQKGDARARAELIERYMPLAPSPPLRYPPPPKPLARAALPPRLRAARRPDPGRVRGPREGRRPLGPRARARVLVLRRAHHP